MQKLFFNIWHERIFHGKEIENWIVLFLHLCISNWHHWGLSGQFEIAWKWQGGVHGYSWGSKGKGTHANGSVLSHRLPKFPPTSTTLSLQAFLFFTSCPAINWFIHSFVQCSLDAAFRIKLVRQLFKISNLDIWPLLLISIYLMLRQFYVLKVSILFSIESVYNLHHMYVHVYMYVFAFVYFIFIFPVFQWK